MEKVVWSSYPDLPGLETLSAENSRRPWRQYHETYTFCIVYASRIKDGNLGTHTAEWIYRSKSHYSAPSSVMLIEPGELHRNTKTPPPDPFSVVFIDPRLIADLASEAGRRPNPHFTKATTTDPRLYRAFANFHTALRKQTSLLHRQSLLVECIGAVLSSYCEEALPKAPDTGKRTLAWAREFLNAHFSDGITLDQLATISGLSRFHFLRAFKKEFGLPPHQYLTSLRIGKVRDLLKSGMLTGEVAAEAGFSDQSHLIRHFKIAMGVTPRQYVATAKSKVEHNVTVLEFGRQLRAIMR